MLCFLDGTFYIHDRNSLRTALDSIGMKWKTDEARTLAATHAHTSLHGSPFFLGRSCGSLVTISIFLMGI